MNVIEASGLKKRFGRTQALAGVDLVARQGTVLGVLGPNGAGKTTGVRVLATLLQPDAGMARISGYDVVRRAFTGSAGGSSGQTAATSSEPDTRRPGSTASRLSRALSRAPATSTT